MLRDFVGDIFTGQAGVRANYLAQAIAAGLETGRRKVEVDRYDGLLCLTACFHDGNDWVEIRRWLATMARTKGKGHGDEKVGNSDTPVGGFAWVNIDLSPEGEQWASELADAKERLGVGFIDLLSYGLDVSVKRGKKDDYMACLYGYTATGAKFGISSWASSPSDALAGLLAKWFIECDGSVPDEVSVPTARRFR